ncbi:MAG: DedA family protein [Bacteroidia bacterium]
MELISHFLDFILHIDVHLKSIVMNYQTWTYLILFAIIFCETGLVVTPFLPGDSLLFAAGSLAGLGLMDLALLLPLFFLSAFAGDNTNYFIGNFIGPKVFDKNYRFIRKEYLEKTHNFYEKHGGKTIIIARFIPIIRTFAPFVAGVGSMTYKKFIGFSIIGNLLWISIFTVSGYLLGSNAFIQQHFSLATLVIIAISVVPIIFGFLKHRFSSAKN